MIYDAPLLIEADAHKRMNKIVVVSADQPAQISRLQVRNHISRAEALRRIRAQIPLRKKLALADYVIDGTLPIERLRPTIRRIYSELKGLAMQAAQEGHPASRQPSREPEACIRRYVEDVCEARTPLEAFFSSLYSDGLIADISWGSNNVRE